ncbi:MAG TPA: response regulator [Candidatus Angelobacter sp.]|nr:response regulator [Candidatus Angelobacter sp.]
MDDEAVGLSVRKLLFESEGYSVFTAENGSEALALFYSERIDVVVLDYMMPGMNGDVVAEEMKRRRPAVPILMLSAYVDLPGEALRCVDKYITKNEPPPVLLDTVAELLNRRQKGISRVAL